MDDTGAVRGGQSICYLGRHVEGPFQRKSAPAQQFGERLTLEVLHNEVGLSVLLSHVVQRADVGVLQCGDGPGFAFEAGALRGLGG